MITSKREKEIKNKIQKLYLIDKRAITTESITWYNWGSIKTIYGRYTIHDGKYSISWFIRVSKNKLHLFKNRTIREVADYVVDLQ